MKTYAIIPARGGSKGIKNKNILPLNGKPLIAYSIEVALQCEKIDRVIVTTDSQEIADIAKTFGAEVPFLRPSALAGDRSLDRDYLEHALSWLQDNEGQIPELLALLRPTTPIRSSVLLDAAVQKMIDNYEDITSLRSVHPLGEPPQKMLQIQGKLLTGFFSDDTRSEYYNLPRQMFPTAYQPNGYIDVLKSSYIAKKADSIFGPKMLAFETPNVVEIDTQDEFDYVEYLMRKKVGVSQNV